MNIHLPVVINSSPGWTFPRQSFKTENVMLTYASKFIKGLLEYKHILDRRAWPVDRATSREKGQPLCMEQYYRFFTSYRVPGIEKDHLRSTWGNVTPTDQHIVVAKDNQASGKFIYNNIPNISKLVVFISVLQSRCQSERGVAE